MTIISNLKLSSRVLDDIKKPHIKEGIKDLINKAKADPDKASTSTIDSPESGLRFWSPLGVKGCIIYYISESEAIVNYIQSIEDKSVMKPVDLLAMGILKNFPSIW